jgi:hypothetical protein
MTKPGENPSIGALSAQLPIPAEEVAYLRQHLGGAFVNWVLADPSEKLTPQQAEVALVMANILRRRTLEQPELPIGLAAGDLVFYRPEWNTTSINYFRQYIAQAPLPGHMHSDDGLLDALMDLAIEGYGEMLLPSYPYDDGPTWAHYLRTPAARKVTAAVRGEGIFPFIDDDFGAEAGTNDGPDDDIYQDFRPLLHGCHIIGAAWNLAKLQTGVPTLDELLGELANALDGIRSLLRGDSARITGAASFTGIKLPMDARISGDWGHIRPARAEDHPSLLKSMVDKRTTTTTDAGDQTEITDAGDVIFETSIEMTMQIKMTDSQAGEVSWRATTGDELSGLIDRVRLAFALAIRRKPQPVIISTWQKVIIPLFSTGPSYHDPQFMASRVPTLLSTDEIESWENWINIVMAADLTHLNLALTRTLRAKTERRDDSDALIDAVIAWESLFGAVTESTLRVSASLARLLHPAGAAREQARSRYTKIYERRSKIVHGSKSKTTPEQINQDSRAAIDAVIEAIRTLLADRPDLLPLDSVHRSTRILMEDDNRPVESAESPPGPPGPDRA